MSIGAGSRLAPAWRRPCQCLSRKGQGRFPTNASLSLWRGLSATIGRAGSPELALARRLANHAARPHALVPAARPAVDHHLAEDVAAGRLGPQIAALHR